MKAKSLFLHVISAVTIIKKYPVPKEIFWREGDKREQTGWKGNFINSIVNIAFVVKALKLPFIFI